MAFRDAPSGLSDLSDIYRTHWNCDVLDGDDELVKDAVARVCDETARKSGRLKLEEKIVLSIGIRGIAESEMRRAMQNNGIAEPESPKFGKLVDCYKKQMPGDYAQHAATVEAVALLTPENIHANSFMYEPLADIGSHGLSSFIGSARVGKRSATKASPSCDKHGQCPHRFSLHIVCSRDSWEV